MDIILTMGNTDDIETHQVLVDNLILSGSNMVRCCVSKASFADHVRSIEYVKNLYYSKTGRPLALMLDVAIPKDKNRIFLNDELSVHNGDEVLLTSYPNQIEKDNIAAVYTDADLSKYLVGDEFIIGDSIVRLTVDEVISPHAVKCCVSNHHAVIQSGLGIASKKGCILKTQEEIYKKCMSLISCLKPECIVLSYVETRADVDEIIGKICSTSYRPLIMSKIETYSSFVNRKDIIEASDEIMIARGCLAVNVGLENLYLAQNTTICDANLLGKKVCVASNILKSMNKSVAPVRSDIMDLAHMISCGVSFIVITDSISRTAKCPDLLQYVNRVENALKCGIIN